MKHPPHIDEATLRKIISEQLEATVIDRPWACDIIRANADLIEQHNQFWLEKGHAPEAKFTNVPKEMRPLHDLLWEDYAYLSQGSRALREVPDDFVLVEISRPSPNARSISIGGNGRPIHVIGFGSQLLHLIHASFSKIWVLTCFYRHADCLPEHVPLLKGDVYSDTNLLAGFFNDIEVLYDQQRLSLPIEPPHLADPYEYCERVEGARRFLLAHELGHAIYFYQPSRPPPDEDTPWLPLSLPPPVLAKWDEEYWCDSYALYTVLNTFKGKELTGPTLFELENAILGILTFFTVMDVIEIPLREEGTLTADHPPAIWRREMVRSIIKHHAVYLQSEKLRAVLHRNWDRLNGFRTFSGGSIAPDILTSVWSRPEFLDKLTPFGRKAYRTLYDHLVMEEFLAEEGHSETLQKFVSDF